MNNKSKSWDELTDKEKIDNLLYNVRFEKKEKRRLEKSLEKLTERVRFSIIQIDKLMQEYQVFSKSEGGSKLAKILNPLDFVNDESMHFGLKIPFQSQTWKKLHPEVKQ